MLPMGNLRRSLEIVMAQYVGPAADYLNLHSIIFELVENRLYGNVMAAASIIISQIVDYGVPEAAATLLLEQMRDDLNLILNRCTRDGIEGYVWQFYFTKRGDLALSCLGKAKAREPSPVELYYASIRDGLARGDYYPENIRRLVGA